MTEPKCRTKKADSAAWWISVGCIAALVLLTRPFRGIFHDGHLYAVQALRRLDGTLLDQDVFFAFGNQDRFSVFTKAYAPAIDALGLYPATLLFYGLGLILWALSVVLLAQRLLGRGSGAFVATGLTLCLYSAYGSLPFSYGEEFVTPRIHAEAFGFIALTLALGARPWLAFLPLGFSLVLHPLMGLSFLALAFWMMLDRKLWFFILGAAFAALGVILGLLGIEPFSWIFEILAPEWRGLVERHAPLVLMSEWPADLLLGWVPLPIFSLLLIWRRGPPQLRDVAAGVLVIGLGFSLVSFIFSDLLGSRFFVGLQLWRAQILLAFFGHLFALAALQQMDRHPRARMLFKLAIGLSILCFILDISPLPVGLMTIAALLAWFAEDRGSSKLGLHWHLAYGVPFLASLAIALSLVALEILGPQKASVLWSIVRLGVLAMVLALLVRPSFFRGPSLRTALVSGSLVAALLMADLRSDRQLFWARGGQVPPDFALSLQGKSVYWEAELVSLWFGLRMPQYYSCRQSGGMVFFQEQAHEIVRRAQSLRSLNTSDFVTDLNSPCTTKEEMGQQGPVSVDELRLVCRSLPELDVLVLKAEIPGFVQGSWVAPFAGDGHAETIPGFYRATMPLNETPYHRYACETLR